MVVKKPDGSNRLCVDFRKLNQRLHFDAEPMPRAEHMFASVGTKKFFSKLDLAKGYWQIPLSESSREKTAFASLSGLYHFRYMPFGLKTAAAVFTKLMREVLHGIGNVQHYIDDVLVATDTWQEHVDTLRRIFTRIRGANLTLKPNKCELGSSSVLYLGHVIGEGNITPNPGTIGKILETRRPQNKKQVRSFLGLAGFYRDFIPGFASVAAPLIELTKKGCNNVVTWTATQEEAFSTLKRLLSTPPILAAPDMTQPFTLRTDASNVGLGAVLLQERDGVLKPVSYASRKLSMAETNYSTIEKECLALVWGIKRFNWYLYGNEFVLQTDHKPLEYLTSTNLGNSRLVRWSLLLQEYMFHVEYIRGSDNVGADFLSRI